MIPCKWRTLNKEEELGTSIKYAFDTSNLIISQSQSAFENCAELRRYENEKKKLNKKSKIRVGRMKLILESRNNNAYRQRKNTNKLEIPRNMDDIFRETACEMDTKPTIYHIESVKYITCRWKFVFILNLY